MPAILVILDEPKSILSVFGYYQQVFDSFLKNVYSQKNRGVPKVATDAERLR